MKVTVYTTTPCPYCRNAKALLDARGITYEEVEMSMDSQARAELMEKTGLMTFPQIVIDDNVIGGFEDLLKLDQAGNLTANT